MRAKCFAVAGGDARQAAAAAVLRREGYCVTGPEKAAEADCILLPLPLAASMPGLEGLLHAAKPGALVLGGKISEEAWDMARQAGAEMVDYYLRPELEMLNAVPTAEGCIAILLAQRKRTLWGSRVLVTGFGRVAKFVAKDILALGGMPVVAARNAAQRAEAQCWGFDARKLEELPQLAAQFDTVVNTVPARLFDEKVLRAMPQNALLVDLASRPGGVDREAAKRENVRLEWALSLPGRCAPETAGEFVVRTVQNILRERGMD